MRNTETGQMVELASTVRTATRDTDCLFADVSGQDLLFSRDFTAEEFKLRRAKIAGKIGKEAHLLIAGAPPVPGDTQVQDALFYYFCGLETCHSYLLLSGKDAHTTLFLPSRDTMAGEAKDRLGFEDAELVKQRLEVEDVKSSEDLTAALAGVNVLYMPHAEVEGGGVTRFGANDCARRRDEEEWDKAEPRHKRLIRLLGERVSGLKIEDASPMISAMRTIKSPAEIDLMRQAGQLSANVMIEAMKATRPGILETRLQAIAEFVFRDQGYCGPGYGIIAASGRNTWDGHYHRNNATLLDGDIVLMDCGPDLRHYTSDIARIWPVSGTYSTWHRKVYGLIVEYHKTLLNLIRPGVLAAEIYEEAAKIVARQCKNPLSPYGDMTPLLEQMIAKGVRYLNHGVGLSVHDAIAPWQEKPLEPGFVCAVDPMVWCEPEHQYIRVEDTVVVTSDGCERLTGAAPIEIDEIEELMKQPGTFMC
ncbi:MAG: Xaa-Pro peptidase family protein [Kiritimatiellia bacterium]|jgi:Xaa-Pro aminopeptidase|nr:Xaa-Pro peptidase family protein [Kiritimatiellia bacterium]MDP6848907.1 Xaa-Pro peptidase family protein [Kiritimatiellia bacterium]